MLSRPLWVRWKVAYDLEGRWEVYRHDGRQSWYVGAAGTQEAASAILDCDRNCWLASRRARESHPPKVYAIPGVWH